MEVSKKKTKEYHKKPNPVPFVLISVLVLGAIGYSHKVEAQYEYEERCFNWGEIFRDPIADALISEPSYTLTTADGCTLTDEGMRVVGCILGGALLLVIDPSGEAVATAQAIGVLGCGGGTGSNPITGIVEQVRDTGVSKSPFDELMDNLFN